MATASSTPRFPTLPWASCLEAAFAKAASTSTKSIPQSRTVDSFHNTWTQHVDFFGRDMATDELEVKGNVKLARRQGF